MSKEKILVSACLLGTNCKYSGGNNFHRQVAELDDRFQLIPVCPECLGGLSIPRYPNEILGGEGKDVLENKAKVVNPQGEDSTGYFLLGAERTLDLAREHNIKQAILKERSPSCGSSVIYSGDFSGCKKAGQGVAAALLVKNGIDVFSEESWKY